MKDRLTDRKATNLGPKSAGYEVRDEVVRGLVLRVGKKGTKVWEIVISKSGRRFRKRLGLFPAVRVKEARILAEQAKQDAHLLNSGNSVRTVSDLFAAYKEARAGSLRTWADIQSVWDVWASEQLGRVRLSDLSIHHGLDLRRHVAQHSSPLRAGAVVRYLRPMLAWAAEEQMIEINPWSNLKVGEKAQARERTLTSSEWHSLWEAAGEMEYPFGGFVQALMLSAQRKSNVAQMRWDEITEDVWLIPRDKFKATRKSSASSHEVPLSGALAELISKQPNRGPFIFTTTGDKPIVPGSKLKAKLDRLTGISNWRLHDVRRTGATLMTTGNEAGKSSRFIVARVLGHSDNTVTAGYDRSAYREEKRSALEVLQATLVPADGLRLTAGPNQ